MEAFEIAYDNENKVWIRRPCTVAREASIPSRCNRAAVILAVQAVVALWILARWRS